MSTPAVAVIAEKVRSALDSADLDALSDLLDPRVTPDRWQILTVAKGRVTDIRGYDDEADAMVAAGLGD